MTLTTPSKFVPPLEGIFDKVEMDFSRIAHKLRVTLVQDVQIVNMDYSLHVDGNKPFVASVSIDVNDPHKMFGADATFYDVLAYILTQCVVERLDG